MRARVIHQGGDLQDGQAANEACRTKLTANNLDNFIGSPSGGFDSYPSCPGEDYGSFGIFHTINETTLMKTDSPNRHQSLATSYSGGYLRVGECKGAFMYVSHSHVTYFKEFFGQIIDPQIITYKGSSYVLVHKKSHKEKIVMEQNVCRCLCIFILQPE